MALAGVVLSVTGGFDRHLFGKKVREAGGRVDNLVHKNVQFVICDVGAIKQNTQRIRKAVKFGIPLVSEGLILQSLKAGRLVDHTPFSLTGRGGPDAEAALPAAHSRATKRAPGCDGAGARSELPPESEKEQTREGESARAMPAPKRQARGEDGDYRQTEHNPAKPRGEPTRHLRAGLRRGVARRLSWLGRARGARLFLERQIQRRMSRDYGRWLLRRYSHLHSHKDQ